MDFKRAREDAGMTLAALAERSGYSIGTINGLELHGEGSRRLREKLTEILKGGTGQTSFRDAPDLSTELETWRKRALRAEQELHALKTKLREMLKPE